VTSRIGYYSDDYEHDDEDPDELRERAFGFWRKNGDRCNSRTLRLARDYALDLGFHPDARAITSALKSRGISYWTILAPVRRRDARTRSLSGSATVRRGSASPSANRPLHEGQSPRGEAAPTEARPLLLRLSPALPVVAGRSGALRDFR
jgi:hypothetical protein